MLVVTKNALPAKNLGELIASLKANPGQVATGTAGVGSASHLAAVYFQSVTGTKLNFVPYRGTGPAMQDLVAGQIDMIVDQTSNSINQVKAGSIKALRSPTSKRLAIAPDMPTAAEAGLPAFQVAVWNGFWLPKGTPKDVDRKAQRCCDRRARRCDSAQAARRLGSRHPGARAADARGARQISQGRDREMVADHQGSKHQAGVEGQ